MTLYDGGRHLFIAKPEMIMLLHVLPGQGILFRSTEKCTHKTRSNCGPGLLKHYAKDDDMTLEARRTVRAVINTLVVPLELKGWQFSVEVVPPKDIKLIDENYDYVFGRTITNYTGKLANLYIADPLECLHPRGLRYTVGELLVRIAVEEASFLGGHSHLMRTISERVARAITQLTE